MLISPAKPAESKSPPRLHIHDRQAAMQNSDTRAAHISVRDRTKKFPFWTSTFGPLWADRECAVSGSRGGINSHSADADSTEQPNSEDDGSAARCRTSKAIESTGSPVPRVLRLIALDKIPDA